MGLKYPGKWKFEGIGIEIPQSAVAAFVDIMVKIADGKKPVVEQFKAAFGNLSSSTSYGWAVSDLTSAADQAASNVAVFIENIWKGIEWAAEEGCIVPSNEYINKLLNENSVPLRIEPPNLIFVDAEAAIADSFEDANIETIPAIVPTFVLGDKLGEGGYGVVYRATRTTKVAKFEFALKILDPSPFVDDYEKAVKRFQKEVRILQSLHHRAIVPYYEAGITKDNKPYVVMPLIEGLNLCDACQSKGVEFTILTFIEILRALEYAHKADIIHRDLKPSNILVRDSDSQPIILDFGSAYTLDQMDTKTLTTQAVGTVGYIPSEILCNPKKRSPLHDIYSCGIMLYESFAGFKPDPANYQSIEAIRPDCKGLDSVIQHAIAGEHERIVSAEKFSRALINLNNEL